MHRFYLPPEYCGGETLTLTDREAHHGLHVLRLRPDERVTVLDGAGRVFLCAVHECNRDSIRLTVVQTDFVPPLPYQLTLIQAIPKGKILEDIIEKATELGAHRIVPLLSERVVSHFNEKQCESKAAKWRWTAIEAIKQCGSAWLPQIEAPRALKEYLAKGEAFELPLMAALQGESRHPREWFSKFYAQHHRRPHTVGVWVGPEGDFTPAEARAVQSAGALPISLGRQVLRCETAAVYCLSVLHYELRTGNV